MSSSVEVMSLKHAVLGFLSIAPMTGYDLRKHMEESVAHFWPADQAQIYRTLGPPRGGRPGRPCGPSRRRASRTGASTPSPTPGWPSSTPGSRRPSSTCRRGRCSWCGCSSSAASAPTACVPSWRSAPRRPASSRRSWSRPGRRPSRRSRPPASRRPRDAAAPRHPRQRARARARRARVGPGPARRADRLSHPPTTDRHPAAGRCPTPEGARHVHHRSRPPHPHAPARQPSGRADLRRRRPRPVHARRPGHGVVAGPGDQRRRAPVRA